MSIIHFPFASGWPLAERLADTGHSVMREWRLRRALRAAAMLEPSALADMGFDAAGLEGAVRHGRSTAPGH